MPLSTGKSNKSRQENVEREIAAGKDPKQAVAIAYSQQRKNKAKSTDCDELFALLSELFNLLQRIKETRL